ncbi:hypothetical protein D9M69_627550 [compost metagenome]
MESSETSIPQKGSVPVALKKIPPAFLIETAVSFTVERESTPETSFSADFGLQLIHRKHKAVNAIINCFFI